jgi:hypothetical protein
MKRKMDLLQQSLVDNQVGTSEQIQAEAEAKAEAILKGNSKFFWDPPSLGRDWGETNVPIVVRKDIGRKNAPSESGTSKKLPRLKAEARWLKEDISPTTGEPAPGRKILSAWQV